MSKNIKKAVALAEQDAEKTPQENGKMTIYDYEQKYVKRQNVRSAKFLVRFFATVIGLFLFACLFFLAYHVWQMNVYAGYVVGAICLIIYICFFIVPLVKIMKSDYFVVNVNAYTAREAKKHNKRLRHEIADKIIDVTARVEGVGWYDSKVVGQLAIAMKTSDEEGIKHALTALYNDSVKKSARDLIFKSALKSATYSAVSQAARIDTALVIIVNLQLIKDLVFLYGFRPSDAKLMKIFGRVLQNSLVAYGLGSLKLGNTVVRSMGDAVKGIPLLGTAIAALVDSSVQGLTNGTLTAVIGYQAIKYLNDEYRLQDILDGIDVAETEAELAETCVELEKQLKRDKKKLAAAV